MSTSPHQSSIGDVTYETTNFLDKNKDFVVAEHQSLMSSSSMPFAVELFYDPESNSGERHGYLESVHLFGNIDPHKILQ